MLILSMIQGITEWLPVSSSAHLALAQHYFFGEVPLIYDMGMHIGTMLAVILYFWKRLFGMLRCLLAWDTHSKEFKLILFLILGSIPTAIIGFSFKGFFISMYSNPVLIGVALLVTALFLFSVHFSRPTNQKTNSKTSIIMGIAQGLAVAPGISRSGSTITAALNLGMNWKDAASFSFLLAIPAIFGATIFLLMDIPFQTIDVSMMFVGVAGAFIFGLASIHLLLTFISRKTFPFFGIYCFLLGLTVILLNYWG